MPSGQQFEQGPNGRLVLTTLGRAALECVSDAGQHTELLCPGKPFALLLYLACSPGRAASREHLIDLLWADLDPADARHSVRQAIWFLRQRLGEHVIAAHDSGLTLCASIDCDREAFLTAIERVEFERAVEHYHGDFLPGFAAPGGADFEQWADAERLRLRQLFRRAADSVVRNWLSRGRLRPARELASRALQVDPHDESAWRLLLETLLVANDRLAAELAAYALERALAEEGRAPEPATRILLARARHAPEDAAPAGPQSALTAELIGREREFSSVLQAWDAARGGAGRHVHVTGAPGLGKSRLLADMHARIRAGGGRAALVRANPGERAVPYALASELATALARLPGAAAVSPASAAALVALNPSLSSCYGAPADRASDLEALRHREFALGELLAAVADEHPVAVMIDDVHWADDDSRQVLSHVLSRALAHPVLAVTTARPGTGGAVGRVSGESLALQPLSAADTGALLASLGRLPCESWAERLPESLTTTARGVPLLILETLHLLLERGTLTLEDGTWTCPDPAALALELARGRALARRIQELDRGPRWLLQLLAVAGTPLATAVLAAAAGRDPEAVPADLQALEVRGLVTRGGSDEQPAGAEDAVRGATRAMPLDQTVLNHIPDAIFIADTEGRIVAANPAASRLTGYAPAELLVHTLPELVPQEDLAAAPPRLAELFAQASLSTERRVRRKDGALVDVEISWTVLPDGRVLGSARDISERLRHDRVDWTRHVRASERRRFVSRTGTEWQPAHDEIAARALELASPDAIHTANAALGRQLAATGHDNPGVLHRAARHFAAAGEDWELARVFTRRVLLQRRRGERRPARALAADMLGDNATSARVSRLVRALPLSVRLGFVTPWRVAAGLASVLAISAGSAALVFRSSAPPPDISLIAIRSSGDSIEALTAPIHRETWQEGATLDMRRLGGPYRELAAAHSHNGRWIPAPDGTTWAFARVAGDSGDIDLFLAEANGTLRRLTAAPGDDDAPSWSPDGRSLVFSTTRGNANRYGHLAVLNVATAQVTELTHGDPGDNSPFWSPDGTRIAYYHSSLGAAPEEGRICLVTRDGRGPTCLGRPLGGLLGWYDADQLLVAFDSSGTNEVVRLNVHTGERLTLDHLWSGARFPSPDGHWLACWCTRAGLVRPDWYVYPSDRPDLARRVLFGTDAGEDFTLRWGPTAKVRHYLERLEISAGSAEVAIGAEHRLTVRGFDAAGAPAPLEALSWRSDDSVMATVEESTGVLSARRLGTVTIRATAGGWRETALELAIVPAPPPTTLVQEDWSRPLEVNWVPFGDPRPLTTDGPEGKRAFWNRGDGWFESGAYSRRRFVAGRGLGFEAWLSTPVVGPRQQFVNLFLGSNLDSAALARWDHRTDNLPLAGLTNRQCGFHYPPGDGIPHPPRIAVADSFVVLPPRVNSGRWYRVRVQIFPDGRCGLALDGKPLALLREAVPTNERYWVVLEGNSLGNRMLVGPVAVWDGVRNDVDWSALDRPATSLPAPPLLSSRPAASPRESPHTAPPRRTPRPPR